MRLFSLLFLFTFLCVQSTHATTYYFSAVSGDDTRTAQQAQNASTPWKTLDKYNEISSALRPGDSILFRRGETWHGTLTAKNSGVAGNVIYYGAYGTGANPVISGFATATGWTLHASGIYYATVDATNLSLVTLNGTARGMGRFPNSGYLNYESSVGNSSITDNQLTASPNWGGAEIVMRKYRFILDRHTVTSHTGNTLNYSTSTVNGNNGTYIPQPGNGYFIQNHVGTLDQLGEWYYDGKTKRLYVYFGAATPSSYTVMATVRPFNAVVEGVDYITLENLAFEGANLKGLSVAYAKNIDVRNCHFTNQGASALHGDYVSNVTVKGGTINTSFSNGINFEHDGFYCTVDGVTVNNTNMIPGTARSGTGVSVGISVTGENNVVRNCRVLNSGYSGIQFLGDNVLIENNFINTFCTLKDDGGGIYTFNGAANEVNANRVLKNNIILNAVGAYAGAERYNYEAFGKAAGIYLDEYVNNVEITGNTIANGDWGGIFLHNAHNNKINNNIIYNFRYQVHVSQYTPDTRNNTMLNNQYIAKTATQTTWYYRTFVLDNPGTMGTFNGNVYARLINDNNTIQVDNFYTNGNGTSFLTLAQWKAAYALDATSQKSPVSFTANVDDSVRFEYNDTKSVKAIALTGSWVDVRNNQYAGTIALQPFTSVVLLRSRSTFLQNQVITFPEIANRNFGTAPFALAATASSGLPVSYRVVSGPATVAGSTLTMTGVGTIVIEATQAGNASFKAAAPVQQSFQAEAPNTQTITFPAIADKAFGDAPFLLTATASSGLPVSYQVISGQATVAGNLLTLTGAGISTIIVEATQAGNATFKAAPPVRRSFGISKGSQAITFGALTGKTFGDAPFVPEVSASSGLPVTLRLVSGPGTLAGNVLTLTGSGEIILEGSQAGNVNWEPASSVAKSFFVAKSNQTINFPVIATKKFGDAPFALNAVASSALPVSYRVVSGPATILGNTVTLTGAGEVFIEASQAGNGNFNPAPAVTRNFVVSTANLTQTINFPTIGTKAFGDAPFALTATASSGLPVSYRVVAGPATVAGNTVTLTGSGNVSIEASQAGNAAYAAAPLVTQTFTVTKATQTIAFAPLPAKNFGDAPFALNATASSGLPVSFRILSGPATVSGNTLTLTGAGTVVVEASQAGDATYNPASAVSQSFFVGKASQTITFPAVAAKAFGDPGFSLQATSTSGLPISYRVVSGPATLSGGFVSLTGAGAVIIEASQAGNNNYNPAASASQQFIVNKGSQTINFPVLVNKTLGDAAFLLTATASSGLPVSYKINSGPATIIGNMVTLLGIGEVWIEASQPGNENYNPAASLSRNFTINPAVVVKQNQTINFPVIATKTFGDAPFALNAVASSGLPVSYRVVSGPATLSGNTITITGVGLVYIEASQPGNDEFNAAPQVTQNFTVNKAAQTISFPAIAAKTFGDESFSLNATATSGLPVSFRIVSGAATISGNMLTITGAGTVAVEANQAGSATYNAAPSVSQVFGVAKAAQVINFPAIATKTVGDAPFALPATASSGLPVSYRLLSGPATLAGNIITITGAGEVWIEASQAGNDNYNPAPSTSKNFLVVSAPKQSQTISFAAIAGKTFGDAPFAVTASASSGLPVSFRIVSGPATVSGNTLTLTGAGTVVIEAVQAGDNSFNAAPSVTQNILVAKAGQTITFNTLAGKTFGDAPFSLAATASSGLPVTFTVVSGPATIAGNTVTLTGAGTVTVEAAQAGGINHNAAAPVQRSFAVSKAAQTITFPAVAAKTFGDAGFSLQATSTSGLPVSYRVVSGPASLSGGFVTLTGAGTVVIEATQAGNSNYNPALAATQQFNVAKGAQSINFLAIPNKSFGDAPFTLTATASSALPVTFTVISGPATVSGNILTLTGVGSVTIEATQAGSANYNAAVAVQRSFAVGKAIQTITFAALPNKVFGDAPFALSATASSGLPVSFRIASGPATVIGGTVTLTGVGTVTIEASQAGDASFLAALVVSQSFTVAKGSQTISFGPIPAKTFGDAPFDLTASASSGLGVNYTVLSGPATISGSTVTLTGAGTVVIEAAQPGNANYNPAASASQSFAVAKAAQTINFPALPNRTLGDAPFVVSATANSGLPVSFRIVSGPATIAGNTVTVTGLGDVIIEASQSGSVNYNPAATVSRTFTVATAPKQNQNITFAPLANKTFGDAPFTLAATASSGLPVSFAVLSGPATISGGTLTITGAGTVVVEASQAGNTTFNPAPVVTQSFAVGKAAQTIAFATPADKVFGDAPFAINATATSGLAVSYRVVSGPATIANNIITLTGAGTVVVEATQAGNGNYNPATAVQRSFAVTKAAQTITFAALPNRVFGDAPFTLNASASSGLPVSFRIVSGMATINGNTLTITGAGTITVEAAQAGDANYNAAALTRSFLVSKGSQTISFVAIGAKTFGDAPFIIEANASSGLPVSYRVVSGPATVAGNTVTITGAGTVVLEASQPGNVNYSAAVAVTQTVMVNKAAQLITFPDITGKTFGDAAFDLTATASSGLPVTYAVISGPATISGATVTITGAGTVVIEATQAGNANYNAATAVQRSFVAGKAAQTIYFAAIANRALGDAPFALNATASSGLAVGYRVVSGPATISGNVVTITGVGTVTVEVSQSGNNNYNAATPVTQSFSVGKASQTITFAALSNKTFGDAPFPLTATASSGQVVSFRIVSGPATLSGNVLTITGAGTVAVEASQAGNATFNAAAPVNQSFTVARAAQTITIAPLPAKAFGDAPFSVDATASSGLPVTFRIVGGPATISGNTITLTGVGTVVVEATQAGNANYNAATAATQSFVAGKASQTITFTAIPNKVSGDAPFAIAASATSGLPVSFRVVSGPATLLGNTVTVNGLGTVVIEAVQAGNATYNAAAPVSRTFTVTPAPKQPQTITFIAISNKTFGDAPFTLSATASSGLPVSFAVASGPATIAGNTVTITGAGTVSMEATQAGNDVFNPALAVTQSFTVAKAVQTITFATPAAKTFGDAPFQLSATASSGLAVAFRIVSGPATLSGNTVTITGAGAVLIEATQAGNNNYTAAAAVQRTLTVNKASQVIAFAPLANKAFGDAPFALNATASSTLPVVYTIVSGPATVAGNTVTITGAGVVTIEAAQAGDANYAPTAATQSFTVSKAAQFITFGAIAGKTFGDASFVVTGTASSGLGLSYRVVSGPATINGNTVTLTGAGTVAVEAAQAGNANYNAATPVTQSFVVGKAAQTITFASLAAKTFGDVPFTVSATASSGLAVSFAIVSGPAIILNNTVTITGTGTVTLEATQVGNGNYSPATPVQRSFNVGKADQLITFAPLPDKAFGDAPFALAAATNSGLPVSFRIISGPATLAGTTVTLTGIGIVTVEAIQAGDANYNAAPAVQRSFTVGKAAQTINFPAITTKAVGAAPFSLSATASSGLPVAYRIISGPATIAGNVVSVTGAGTVVIEASQAGNEVWNAATPISQSFTVTKGAQSITFATLAGRTFGDAPFSLAATASSGLPVSYRVVSGPATVNGTTVSLTGAGTVTIEATQAGDVNYNAAVAVTQSFVVAKAVQTINFTAIPNKLLGEAPFAISASASSGLAVSFRVLSGPATLAGNTVTITGLGTVVIEAAQPGNANYNAATPVQRSFTVSSAPKQNQTITFTTIPNKTFGDAPFTLTATASSGLPVSFQVMSGPATIIGNTVTLSGAGTVVIEAVQPGNDTWNQALPVAQTITVAKASQSISFAAPADKAFGDAPFALTGSANSGLPVSFRVASGPATISGNVVTLTGAGVVTIEALQGGNANYNAAAAVQRSFSVNKASQTITFAALGNRVFGEAPFALSATASSGLAVTFRVVSGAAAINGSTVSLTGTGTVTIEALQAGNENYAAATAVTRSFVVERAAQTITFLSLGDKIFGDAPFALTATASSNLPVSYAVISGPATVAGNTLSLTGAGLVTIEAMQTGSANYFAALPVRQSFTVAKASQAISFAPLPNKVFGDAPFQVAATASSGAPVALRIVSGPATISGNTVTLTAVGLVTIEASQSGNGNYNTAMPVTQSFTVGKAGQVISFPLVSNKNVGDAPFQLTATANSGLPVSYRFISGPATIAGSTVTITGAGIISIEASQAGNENYAAAAPVVQNITAGKGSQTISFPVIAAKTFGDVPFAVVATASSGLPVGFRIVNGPATINGNTLTLTGAGTVTIEATQAGDANYNAAPAAQQSFVVGKATQTITFPAIADKIIGDPAFALSATASSGLAVSYRVVSGPATLVGNTVTLTGIGTVVIEASQAGNNNFSAATAVSRSFAVTAAPKLPQSITFAAIGQKTFGDAPFVLSATASSGLPVAFRVVSGPATLSGSILSLSGAGVVTIEASQSGDAAYNSAAPVTQSMVVNKAVQTIGFAPLPDRTLGDAPFSLQATASSGLAVGYRVVAGPATLAGNLVTLTGVGMVTIEAAQAGSDNYTAAAAVTRSFAVNKAAQTITFNAISNKTFGDAPFALLATSSSGLPVSYRIVSGPAMLNGSTVTITGAGAIVVEASQSGNASFSPAAPVQRSFTVTKAAQVITFAAIANKTVGEAPFTLAATASSGLPVSFRIVSGPATLSGNLVTLTGAGTVVIEATQGGNENYNAAPAVQRSFGVGKADQTITFGALTDKTFGDAPFALGATASSNLPVSYRIVSGPATINGATVTINGAGVVLIEASQPGNENYNAAPAVQRSFEVSKASQIITFAAIPDKILGDAPFGLNASASSGLAVTFRIISGPATLSGNTLALTGAGVVTVEALQTGNENYSAAAPVQRSFTVGNRPVVKQAQTITFGSIGYKTYTSPAFELAATASSGLPVSYRVVSGPIAINGNLVSITGVGAATIEASQPGNDQFHPATSVLRSFTIGKAGQTISFTAPAARTFGDAPFELEASATSGLAVTFRIVSGPATLSGNLVTLTGTGTVVVEATQAGNANFNAAFAVQRSFTVNAPANVKKDQIITFEAVGAKSFGDAPFVLNGTATSGLLVSYRIISGPATLSGNMVTLTGAGTLVIEASQGGNDNFNAAPLVTQTIAVGKASQIITFGPLADRVVTDVPFVLSATSSSGLGVSFRVVSGAASLAGNVLTLTGTGIVIVEAAQEGTSNIEAASPVQRSFTVTKAAQVITFAAIANKTVGEAPFALAATASSGLPVSFRIVSGPAILSGDLVTLTGTGTVVVEATQGGSDRYIAAAPATRSFVVSNAPKQDQTITFNAISDKTFGEAPFAPPASASSGLPVAYRVISGPATVNGSTIVLTGAGTVVLEASQAGNNAYNAAPPVQRSFGVGKAAQAITFAAPSSKMFGDVPFTLTASASSALPVGLRIVSGPAVVNGNVVALTGAGVVTVEAWQSGNENYLAANPVQRSITVEKAAQAISFGTIPAKIFGDVPFAIGATASSGLPVSFKVTSGPATVSGNTVTITGAGTVVMEANQGGNANYAAAPPVQSSFAVSKVAQAITFPALADKIVTDAPFTVNATATSGLPISFRILAGPATIAGRTVTLAGAGDVTIEALQAGNEKYLPVSSVQTFSVSKLTQSITVRLAGEQTFGNAPFALVALASSGLPVSYNVVSGPATVAGSIVTITGAGTIVVDAVQPGNALYNAAAPVRQNIVVKKATQLITFAALTNRTFGNAPFALGGTASSGLTVSYRIVSGPATVSGNMVTLTGAGTVTVEALQAGNANYNAATPVQRSFSVAKATQTITFANLPSKTFGDPPFTLAATSTSGLPISYRVVSGPATVSGSVATLTGTGTVIFEATQPGNANYLAAAAVRSTLVVVKKETQKSQSITFNTLSYKTFTSPDFILSATASSGLPVSFRVVSGPVKLKDKTVSIEAAGNVTIEAYQPGNATYEAAPPVQRSFSIGKATQTIEFPYLPIKSFGAAPFKPEASASSDLPVSYRILFGPATVSGNEIRLTGVGLVGIEASQAGNQNYLAAAPVQRLLIVMPPPADLSPVTLAGNQKLPTADGAPGEKDAVAIYPNPVAQNGTIQVKVIKAGTGSISVYDNTGTLVKQYGTRHFKKGQSAVALDVQFLRSGTYHLRFAINGQVVNHSFQIMK